MRQKELASAFLALEEGTIFRGFSPSTETISCGEIVYNTSSTGYQEIVTDPSYSNQLVVFTSPHIGNTGINFTDDESTHCWLSGLIVKELSTFSSHWKFQESLSGFLAQKGIPILCGIDTRKLTRLLRDKGSLHGCLVVGDVSEHDAVRRATCYQEVPLQYAVRPPEIWNPYTNYQFLVYLYDYGVKTSLLRRLSDLGCRVVIVSPSYPVENVIQAKPDGVVFSNGPGDPSQLKYAIPMLQRLIAHRLPVLGICLGCQLLGMACGAATIKLKQGHRGINHPVLSVNDQRVLMTSQNHGYAVAGPLPPTLTLTHVSLFDGTVEGFQHCDAPALGLQFHPEAGPGPTEAATALEPFIEWMSYAKR